MESAEINRTRRNRRVYLVGSLTASAVVLWPLVTILRNRAEMGTAWAAFALSAAAFALGVSISMLSLPWLANSNRTRLSAITAGLLTGPMAASLCALALIYHRGNPLLFISAAATTVIALGMLGWNLRRRQEPAHLARLWSALAVIALLELGLGYLMTPEWLRPFN